MWWSLVNASQFALKALWLELITEIKYIANESDTLKDKFIFWEDFEDGKFSNFDFIYIGWSRENAGISYRDWSD